jgi:hypothetical protein
MCPSPTLTLTAVLFANTHPASHRILHTTYHIPHTAYRIPQSSQVKAYCTRSGRKEADVQKYLSTRRRNRVTNTKIVKYVEAAWRFIFYSSFCALGYYALFVPTTAPWISETMLFFVGWPYHPVSSAVAIYYQVELGCYVHQLFWTEVTRSDAVEMILHHLITIALITISFLNNFTRMGSVILLLHDSADIFLEFGKVLNYISKVKGNKWLSPVVDTFFGLFAVSFFVTRLVLYPRFILWSMSTEGYTYFGGWAAGWSFVALLFALQFLHIFWFYLILRMVVKICSSGSVEKDERSDDEEEEEEELDDVATSASPAKAAKEGKKSK